MPYVFDNLKKLVGTCFVVLAPIQYSTELSDKFMPETCDNQKPKTIYASRGWALQIGLVSTYYTSQ